MEKLRTKGIVFRDEDEVGNEIIINAVWVVGNKATVNYYWMFYGDGSVDKQLFCQRSKNGQPIPTKQIEEQVKDLIEAIKRDCLDEYVKSMFDD